MKRPTEASGNEQISGMTEAETMVCSNTLHEAVFGAGVGSCELGIEQSKTNPSAEPAERSRSKREHFEEVESEVF